MTHISLSDDQWQRIAKLLPREKGHRGRPYAQDHRTTIEGILWIACTGAVWRDLPDRYGKWNTVYHRFRRWSCNGVFDKVFAALVQELDLDVMLVDGAFVKVHPDGTEAPKEDALSTGPQPQRT